MLPWGAVSARQDMAAMVSPNYWFILNLLGHERPQVNIKQHTDLKFYYVVFKPSKGRFK